MYLSKLDFANIYMYLLLTKKNPNRKKSDYARKLKIITKLKKLKD